MVGTVVCRIKAASSVYELHRGMWAQGSQIISCLREAKNIYFDAEFII